MQTWSRNADHDLPDMVVPLSRRESLLQASHRSQASTKWQIPVHKGYSTYMLQASPMQFIHPTIFHTAKENALFFGILF